MCGAWERRRAKKRRWDSDEIRNQNTEIRRKPEIRGQKSETCLGIGWALRRIISDFGLRALRISFGFRYSDFGSAVMSLDLRYVDDAVARIGPAPDGVI